MRGRHTSGQRARAVRGARRALLAGGLAISMLVAGCAGDAVEVSTPRPAPPPSPTSTPTPTPTPVTLPEDAPALTDVLPAPTDVRADKRQNFHLRPDTVIAVPAGARRVGGYLRELLAPATGFQLPVVDDGAGHAASPAITLRLARAGEVRGEAYRLEVSPGGVSVTAATVAGLFNGVHTLHQLLPADIEGARAVRRTWAIAGGVIADRPRFAYRGTMLDVARHFFGVAEVKRHIDRIARFKVNHLHLHLSDDQGWRIEIKRWPKLATVGGRTQVGGGKGGYYTQAQYRQIVAHAASRGITIVPEIDMPGHTNAALSAYAELNCDGRARPPYTRTQVGFSSLCIDKDLTYRFARDVITELAAITPGPFLHVGGDEAHQTSEAAYARYFARVLPMITKVGKRPLAWHDYAKTALPKSAAIQYWRIESANTATRKAAAAGRQVIMSPANKTYLDMKYSANDSWGNKWAGPVSVRTSYEWNPARVLGGVRERSIIGVDAPLWTELVESEEDIERMAFPRVAAIAEVGWTAQADRSWSDFRKRLAAQGPRMRAQGIAFHPSPEVPW